ncbi:dipeptide ABC transporter ATP-binding protein [bacterium]|nr:dipeptide ABC transporter ATP-binding protein [bacterium]
MTETSKILEVKNLFKWFPIHGGVLKREVARVHAVNGVSFDVTEGETLGLVGESGCGKSTVGRTLLRLYEADGGEVHFNGTNLAGLSKAELRDVRKDVQMIFQDPYESLNSRMTVRQIILEPFEIHGIGDKAFRESEVQRLLKRVGLPASAADKYPHEFSGGQRQRIGIARAVALKPKIIICDEPVSALDVSIQSQVVNLLLELQEELGLSFVFIAHDLAIVRHVSDKVAVMYLGEIVEYTDADSIYENPMHPYTQALISAIPEADPELNKQRIVLQGEVPSPINPPSGCKFHPRCRFATDKCKQEKPEYRSVSDKTQHFAACHHSEEIRANL